jgi:hypothetical protein
MIENIIPIGNNIGTYFTDRIGEGKFAEIAVDKLFKEFDLDWKQFR